jgi:hypothetical protein
MYKLKQEAYGPQRSPARAIIILNLNEIKMRRGHFDPTGIFQPNM